LGQVVSFDKISPRPRGYGKFPCPSRVFLPTLLEHNDTKQTKQRQRAPRVPVPGHRRWRRATVHRHPGHRQPVMSPSSSLNPSSAHAVRRSMNLCNTANATRALQTIEPTSQTDLIIRNPQQLVFSPPAKQNHEPLQPARLPSPEALMAPNSHMDKLPGPACHRLRTCSRPHPSLRLGQPFASPSLAPLKIATGKRKRGREPIEKGKRGTTRER
jgi:hypothetical protein